MSLYKQLKSQLLISVITGFAQHTSGKSLMFCFDSKLLLYLSHFLLYILDFILLLSYFFEGKNLDVSAISFYNN